MWWSHSAVSSTERPSWRMRGWRARVGLFPAMPKTCGRHHGQKRHRTYVLRRQIGQRCLLKWKSEGKQWLETAVSRETKSTLTSPCVDDSRKASAVHKHRTVHPALAHQSSNAPTFLTFFVPPPFQFFHASATIALLTAALPTIGRIIHSSLPRKLASFAASRR